MNSETTKAISFFPSLSVADNKSRQWTRMCATDMVIGPDIFNTDISFINYAELYLKYLISASSSSSP